MVHSTSGGRGQTSDGETGKADEAFLDKHYPFIEYRAEPPGRFVNAIWQGESGWRTRHGSAVVHWGLGRPSAASSALLPDGSRGYVSFFLDHGFRRPSSGPRRWVYGTLDIKSDDVRFIDGVQPSYAPPPLSDKPDLEAELARDAAFLEALKDDRFARAVYGVLVNRTFFKGDHDGGWDCGDRQAARLVAGLRNLGESYLDYFVADRLPGMWPDERQQRRKQLNEEIEQASRPFVFDLSFLDRPLPFEYGDETGDQVVETQAQLETLKERLRARAQALAPEAERYRRERLLRLQAALADFEQNENADVYEALRAHLTRLGWRTETDDDQARAERATLARRIEVLRRIKQLEALPNASTPTWADPLATRLRQRAGTLSGPAFAIRQDIWEKLSAEEREAYNAGAMTRRLDLLAVTGRVSREEHERLISILRN